MKTISTSVYCIVVVALISHGIALAQTPVDPVFTYQGQLKQAGSPTNGEADFIFRLWDAQTGGNLVGTDNLSAVPVADGFFTVQLDFGSDAFAGEARWLEIEVEFPSGEGNWTTLSPRQPVTSTPYALYALNGGGNSPWETTGSGIYYDAGRVGIGWGSGTFPLYPLDVRSGSSSGSLYAYNSGSGPAAVVSSDGTALVVNSGAYSGNQKGVFATVANPDGFALYGLNEAEEGAACAIYGQTDSPVGFGGYFEGRGYFSDKVGIGTASPIAMLHVIDSDSDAITGVCIGEGTSGTLGHEWAGVYARNDYPGGFAGYFIGRGYFSDRVGIGIDSPQTTLHLGGESGVDGIIFPDGTQQNTAAVGGGGDSLWSESGNDIFYTAGDVGIGTSNPSAGLHVADDTRIDGNLGVGTTPTVYAAVDVHSDANYFGLRVEKTAAVNGAAITGSSTATSGSSDGVRGSSTAPDGSGIYGTGEIGVEGWNNTETGIGVIGTHYSTSGDAPGVYGKTNSTTSGAAGVLGEATDSSAGETIGVLGISHSALGAGVYGKADNTSAMSMGGRFECSSPNGVGVHATADGTNSFAGMFMGRGYFSDNVGIGTSVPQALLDVAGTARVDVIQIDGGADLSEKFAIGGHPQPGTVVVIDSDRPGALRTSNSAYDRRVAGIISGAGGVQTGLLMGQEGSLADGEHPVALTGRVYCWCDASNGAIVPGDMLTTADTPGHAMKVTDYSRAQGAIIGKAMTPLEHGQRGLVLVLVNLQ